MCCGAPDLAHADLEVIENDRYFDDFDRSAIAARSIDVDTTSGYQPSIERVVAFVNDDLHGVAIQ